MVWQKKASAPDYANLLEKIAALTTGGPDAWLMPWFNLMPGNTVLDVNAFCAEGPPEAVEFTALDFLGAIGGGRFGAAVSGAQLGEKLGQWAWSKLFEAYCENAVTTGQTCTPFATATAELGDGRQFVTGYGWTIPAGVQKIRWTVVSWGSGTHDLHLIGYASGSNIANPSPDGGSYMTPGVPGYSTWTAALTTIGAYSNSPGTVIEFAWCVPGSLVPFVADPIVEPPTAIPPPARTYTTIADVGAELDNIEQKIHWVLDYTLGRTIDLINPLIADDILTVEADDEDIPLGPDVIGFIVSLSTIGPDVDERFGEPRMLHKLGRVVMGNGTAWMPPVEITVAPMMLLKPDATITACRVQVYPPATATVTTMVRAPLVG